MEQLRRVLEELAARYAAALERALREQLSRLPGELPAALRSALRAAVPPARPAAAARECLHDTYADGNSAVVVVEGDAEVAGNTVTVRGPCGVYSFRVPPLARRVTVTRKDGVSVVRVEL